MRLEIGFPYVLVHFHVLLKLPFVPESKNSRLCELESREDVNNGELIDRDYLRPLFEPLYPSAWSKLFLVFFFHRLPSLEP
jgi:hypothetical protein